MHDCEKGRVERSKLINTHSFTYVAIRIRFFFFFFLKKARPAPILPQLSHVYCFDAMLLTKGLYRLLVEYRQLRSFPLDHSPASAPLPFKRKAESSVARTKGTEAMTHSRGNETQFSCSHPGRHWHGGLLKSQNCLLACLLGLFRNGVDWRRLRTVNNNNNNKNARSAATGTSCALSPGKTKQSKEAKNEQQAAPSSPRYCFCFCFCFCLLAAFQ